MVLSAPPVTMIGWSYSATDGKGFNVQLDAVPVSGRVVLRVNEPKPKASSAFRFMPYGCIIRPDTGTAAWV